MQLVKVVYLRKCSNPDLPQQIDPGDSIKLDLKCIEEAHSSIDST